MMIPGVAVAMGGQDWMVPPLTLGQLRRLLPKVRQLTEIGAAMGDAQIGVLGDHLAVAHGGLHLGNAGAVLNAVLTGSGLKAGGAAMGEAVAPGVSPGADRAKAGPTPEITREMMTAGENSMASLPPSADTATR